MLTDRIYNTIEEVRNHLQDHLQTTNLPKFPIDKIGDWVNFAPDPHKAYSTIDSDSCYMRVTHVNTSKFKGYFVIAGDSQTKLGHAPATMFYWRTAFTQNEAQKYLQTSNRILRPYLDQLVEAGDVNYSENALGRRIELFKSKDIVSIQNLVSFKSMNALKEESAIKRGTKSVEDLLFVKPQTKGLFEHDQIQ